MRELKYDKIHEEAPSDRKIISKEQFDTLQSELKAAREELESLKMAQANLSCDTIKDFVSLKKECDAGKTRVTQLERECQRLMNIKIDERSSFCTLCRTRRDTLERQLTAQQEAAKVLVGHFEVILDDLQTFLNVSYKSHFSGVRENADKASAALEQYRKAVGKCV